MGIKNINQLSFLTWNLYLGADITPLMKFSPNHFSLTVTEVFRQALATNFPDRVKAITHQIALLKPDIIGLQEAVKWQFLSPNFKSVTIDFLQLLLLELKNRGVFYKIATINKNITVDYPDSYGNVVKLTDRDVILILDNPKLTIINKKQAKFNNNLIISVPGYSLEIFRGWSFVDVSYYGAIFSVMNTHLEPYSVIQLQQAKEILIGPAKTNNPFVILGDLNSNAVIFAPTYRLFIDSGFQDIWRKVGKGLGFTCCQDPDLLNATSKLESRIDFILYKNGWNPVEAKLVGDKLQDRTSTGLWPSDHAGVFGKLAM
ncbi:MAG TPA: endonuclease/exonuclease/phosphatase family protein [Bacillales bacterium]|nr:endonuclease/exonuclease/phosphatase family protein [Bacillales bacterium]